MVRVRTFWLCLSVVRSVGASLVSPERRIGWHSTPIPGTHPAAPRTGRARSMQLEVRRKRAGFHTLGRGRSVGGRNDRQQVRLRVEDEAVLVGEAECRRCVQRGGVREVDIPAAHAVRPHRMRPSRCGGACAAAPTNGKREWDQWEGWDWVGFSVDSIVYLSVSDRKYESMWSRSGIGVAVTSSTAAKPHAVLQEYAIPSAQWYRTAR